jgi:hypothetical protein
MRLPELSFAGEPFADGELHVPNPLPQIASPSIIPLTVRRARDDKKGGEIPRAREATLRETGTRDRPYRHLRLCAGSLISTAKDSRNMGKTFMSYVSEDKDTVDRLADSLRGHGIHVWLDREEIKPGQWWQDAIRDAIRDGEFFLACFSANSANRGRSYANEEITLAIEEIRLRPHNQVWFIPVILNGGLSVVPDIRISAVQSLRGIQAANLGEDWNTGIDQIVSVIARGRPLVRLFGYRKPNRVIRKQIFFVTIFKCFGFSFSSRNYAVVGPDYEIWNHRCNFNNGSTVSIYEYNTGTILKRWDITGMAGTALEYIVSATSMAIKVHIQIHNNDDISGFVECGGAIEEFDLTD